MKKIDQDVLNRGDWYRGLPIDLREQIIAVSRCQNLGPGQAVFLRGDSATGIYAVISGSVRICGIQKDGREVLLIILGPSHWFGEIALFDGGVRTHDVYANTDTTLLHVPQESLKAILNKCPEYWSDFGRLMSLKVRLALSELESVSVLPFVQRLARRLVNIAQDYNSGEGVCRVINIPQEQLAAMLSVSRQTVNQALRSMEEKGVVVLSYGSIEILDFEELKKLRDY